MRRGKLDGELDLYFAYTDDAWERTSRLLAMTHSLMVTVGNMFGGKLKHESPDHFNDTLKSPPDSKEAIEGDYPWAEPELTNGQQQKEH